MRRIWIALLLALLPMSTSAQDAPASADAVAMELARINATLKEIAALLSRQSDLQSVDLLMKRVQLSEGQVAELEGRLRSAQGELRDLETERSNVEMRLEMTSKQLERAGPDEPASELEALSAQAEEELKRVRQRAGQLTQEIAGLENELGTRRDDLRSWQTVLDRRLTKQTE